MEAVFATETHHDVSENSLHHTTSNTRHTSTAMVAPWDRGNAIICLVVAFLTLEVITAASSRHGSFAVGHHGSAFLSPNLLRVSRGGATIPVEDDDEEEESDYEVDDEEEEEEEDETYDATLAAAALKSVEKQQQRKRAKKHKEVKEEVVAKLTKKKKKSGSLVRKVVPYIVRASLNPFTLVAMVKSYWVSLFDVDYLKKRTPTHQELRSALEEKAKRSGPSPGKGKRKMKRGQAKTLADLPKLNA